MDKFVRNVILCCLASFVMAVGIFTLTVYAAHKYELLHPHDEDGREIVDDF
jgi:hypothetical protein